MGSLCLGIKNEIRHKRIIYHIDNALKLVKGGNIYRRRLAIRIHAYGSCVYDDLRVGVSLSCLIVVDISVTFSSADRKYLGGAHISGNYRRRPTRASRAEDQYLFTL